MKSIFKVNQLKKYFSTCLNNSNSSINSGLSYEYPDLIIKDLKEFLKTSDKSHSSNSNNMHTLSSIENRVINNIHYFDSDQYADLVTLFGSNGKGTVDLWDLLNRKIGDYDLNFIQAREIKNCVIDSGKYHSEIDWYCSKIIYSFKESENQRSTYDMIKH